MGNNGNLWQVTLPHNCRALQKLSESSFCFMAFLGHPAAGEGEGKERQPGQSGDKSRGSGRWSRAAASLDAASPGQGRVKREGLGRSPGSAPASRKLPALPAAAGSGWERHGVRKKPALISALVVVQVISFLFQSSKVSRRNWSWMTQAVSLNWKLSWEKLRRFILLRFGSVQGDTAVPANKSASKKWVPAPQVK